MFKGSEKDKEIRRLKNICNEQTLMINNFRLLNRDLSLGPHEFIVSSPQAKFKDFKILHKEKDITKSVTKIVLYGQEFI